MKNFQVWSFFRSVFSCTRTKYGDLLRRFTKFGPNAGKEGPEKNPCFDTFETAVSFMYFNSWNALILPLSSLTDNQCSLHKCSLFSLTNNQCSLRKCSLEQKIYGERQPVCAVCSLPSDKEMIGMKVGCLTSFIEGWKARGFKMFFPLNEFLQYYKYCLVK